MCPAQPRARCPLRARELFTGTNVSLCLMLPVISQEISLAVAVAANLCSPFFSNLSEFFFVYC